METNRRVFLSGALTLANSLGRVQGAVANGRRDACLSTTSGSATEPTTDQIQQIVLGYGPPAGVGAAVGVASPSFGAKIVCIGALDDQNGNPLPFTTDTPFEVASITKTVTAAAYESLVLKGYVRSTDTLGRFLGTEVNSQIQAIPLKDLADFTSGLPEDNHSSNGTLPSTATGDYTDAEMLGFLQNPPFPITGTGQVYTYSNLGFALLAASLQDAAGMHSFASLCDQQILGPLGMAKTQPYGSRPRGIEGHLPRGFDQNGNAVPPGWPPFPAYDGAGGLVSTPNDMMTWLQFNMGIIQAAGLSDILPVVHAPAAPGASGVPVGTLLALGWFISQMSDASGEITVIQKDGNLPGFSSQIAFLSPNGCSASNAGVFVLTNWNTTSFAFASNIAYDLVYVMAGLQPPSDKSRYPHPQG